MKLYNKLQEIRNVDNKIIVVYNYQLVDGDNILLSFNVDGVAKCAPEDKFEFVKGRRLAESKAHKKALSKVHGFFIKRDNELIDELSRIDKYHKRFLMALDKEIAHVKSLCKQ